MGIGFALRSTVCLGEVDFGINGIVPYQLFGKTLWITTSHVSMLIIMLVLIGFGIAANIAIRKADPYEVPSKFVNIIELLVSSIDNLTRSNMGEKHGGKFSNYIGTLFAYILLSNISGLFGLRPPTADYGSTLALALITFVLIHYNGFKYEKAGHVTKLFQPVILTPINIIGEIATPLSMSLRLFGNVLSGTVLSALIYGLVPKIVLWVLTPALGAVHGYLDVFSGAIQAFVFCMLTMVFISQNFPENE